MEKKKRELETRVRLDDIFAEAEREPGALAPAAQKAPAKSRARAKPKSPSEPAKPTAEKPAAEKPAPTTAPPTKPKPSSPAQPKAVQPKAAKSRATIVRYALQAGLGLLFAALVLFGLLMWHEVQQLKRSTEQKAETTQSQDALLGAVAEHFLLPEGEPIVMKVDNQAELAGQEFFARAQNGDKVLMYGVSGQENVYYAVIYRLDERKVINAGQVEIGPSGAGLQTQ